MSIRRIWGTRGNHSEKGIHRLDDHNLKYPQSCQGGHVKNLERTINAAARRQVGAAVSEKAEHFDRRSASRRICGQNHCDVTTSKDARPLHNFDGRATTYPADTHDGPCMRRESKLQDVVLT